MRTTIKPATNPWLAQQIALATPAKVVDGKPVLGINGKPIHNTSVLGLGKSAAVKAAEVLARRHLDDKSVEYRALVARRQEEVSPNRK